ncbi:DUF1656 domain-containing protein [Acinetobacter larvae]|uniref:DUF1656 domain-containing protein n=1 Tax=Acinetobacter larvae TaxID=1789224 RepID=A0A1B2LVV8_9GAMM|nr:DUF1656 domain-containing protein [Acinetobacter larvae]AOA57054.1 hypothetical protein BFG52_00930 [Acinetobacter larvae]
MGEFNFYDIYIPTLLLQAILAYVLYRVLGPVWQFLIASGWVILPSLFNLCVYIMLVMLVHGIFLFFGI